MRCPGQDTQYWKPGAIYEAQCPQCSTAVEFFKDDTTRRCHNCGHRFVNPKLDFGCAAYCPFAEQCLGNLPPELMAEKEHLLKDRVAIELKRYLRTDFVRIGRAARRARHAEQMARRQENLRLPVVLTAAYLLELASDGPAAVRQVLERAGAQAPLVAQVQDLLEGRSSECEISPILHDADLLAQLEADLQTPGQGDWRASVAALATEAGKAVARQLLDRSAAERS